MKSCPLRILYHKKLKEIIVVSAIALLITIIIGWKVIFSGGVVLMAEQFEVYTLDSFIKVIYPIWNENIQAFCLADLPKLYLYGSAYLVAKIIGISYQELQRVLLFAPHFLAFVGMYYLASLVLYHERKAHQNLISAPSFISAFIYTVNPWIAYTPRNIVLRLAYATLPFILLLFINMLDREENNKEIIILSLVLSVITGYRFIILLIPEFILLILIYFLYGNPCKKSLKTVFKQLFFVGALFTFLSLAKFLPGLIYALFLRGESIVDFSEGMIKGFPLLEVLSMRVIRGRFDETYRDPLSYCFLIVTLFSFFSLLLISKQNIRAYAFSALSFVLYVSFSTLEEGPIGSILVGILMSMGTYGRLLRHGRWNSMFVLLSISLLSGLSILRISEQRKPKKSLTTVTIMIIALFSSVSAWPLFTGNSNGFWNPSEIPLDYINANLLLKNQMTDDHVLWLPPFSGYRAVWDKSSGLSLISSPTGIFPVRSSTKPTYNTPIFDFFRYFNFFAVRSPDIVLYNGNNLYNLFSDLNIQYIVLHNDSVAISGVTNDDVRQVCQELKNNPSVETIYEGEYLTLFKLPQARDKISQTKPMIAVGGLSVLGSITDSGEIARHTSSLIFVEDIPFQQLRDLMRLSNTLITNNGASLTNLLRLAEYSDQIVSLEPASVIGQNDPEKTWSSTEVYSQMFQRLLRKSKIGGWRTELSHGKAIAVTKAPAQIEERIKPSLDDLITQWNFSISEQVNNWTLNHPEIQERYGDGNSLIVAINYSTQDQKQIRSPLIAVEPGKAYIIDFDIQGENIEKLYSSIKEINEKGKVAESTIYNIQTEGPTFGWTHVRLEHVVKSAKAKFIQLRIEYGQEPTLPPPYKIWLDNFRIYDVSSYLTPNSLEMRFSATVSGKQDLLVRYMKSKAGGILRIFVDDNPVAELDTQDDLNQFIWEKIATLDLEKGEHKLRLENCIGLNAFDQLVFLPSQNYTSTDFDELLNDKRIVYIFEAENGLYGEKTLVSSSTEASNGKVLTFKRDSVARQAIQIPITNNYKLALHGKGSFTIIVDNSPINMESPLPNSTSLNWIYSEPFTLDKGTHTLEIRSNSAALDVIWLYSIINQRDNLSSIFLLNEHKAEVIKHRKVDPTKYEIKVNATKPFMLAFAEAYDPFWELDVNGRIIHPIKLNHLINGFWIDQTGYLTITIEYAPQTWFYYGIAISTTTLVIIFFFLLLDFIRSRHRLCFIEKCFVE